MLIRFLELRRTGDCNITEINMYLQHRVTPVSRKSKYLSQSDFELANISAYYLLWFNKKTALY